MNSEEEFFDAVTGTDSDNSSGEFADTSQRIAEMTLTDQNLAADDEGGPQENGVKKHRTTLPAPMFSRNNFSVWSILKKCIGLELSKITMPIVFNEPLSFLQRITEYMEHIYLINKACSYSDPLLRMQSVAAFAVSAVASQWERTGKPFNPLLGETYELTREDLGFRLISEQVSHHPPISAFYAEGLNKDFIFHGSIYPKLKFWGKSVEAEPRGTITLELLKIPSGRTLADEKLHIRDKFLQWDNRFTGKKKIDGQKDVFHGSRKSVVVAMLSVIQTFQNRKDEWDVMVFYKHKDVYTWTNPTCCVHNVIIGKLWIEQYGTVEILNHSTSEKCILNFKPCGLFGKELHRVEGYIQDKNKKKLCVIYGKWTECLWSVDPATYEAFKKSEKKGEQKKNRQNEESVNSEADEADDMPEVQETVQVIAGSKLLWRICSRPSNSSQMYNFTNFAVTLNELDKDVESSLAPTDCRLRPDIRFMENGDLDQASKEKERLEEKQRAARRERAKTNEEWSTRWFAQGTNPHTKTSDWLFTGGYFDRKFTDCPDIY